MAYIIERNDRFYVVAYDGNDPYTGRERRRWHPAGTCREDAEAIASRLNAERRGARERITSALTVEQYLLEVWLPRRRRELRPSTARRYQWYVENYITPAIGAHRLACVRAEHLDRMYNDLLTHGGRDGGVLSSKTVYDVHVVMRSSLRFAVDRHLVDHNVATEARPPRISTRSRPSPEIWTAPQLASFLAHTAHLRLYPAIHLAATTGMRRGEIAGLRWGDWQTNTHRLSIARSRQSIQGGTVEVPTKTAASRRSIDLDANTEQVLTRWRRRQQRDGHSVGVHDPIFTNQLGRPVNPESISQLFDRKTLSSGLPRIRLHDLRHTHASLLVAAGEPIKVVSERLGHAHPGFTMATYQHLLPGMGAAAATNFAALLTTASGQSEPTDPAKRRLVVGRRSTGPAPRIPRSTTRSRPTR
ncbi:MAG TPA: site-specific integrase [Ilumatobacter sp.]|nr:site-specific integrase [Ilumatobacter sp.]